MQSDKQQHPFPTPTKPEHIAAIQREPDGTLTVVIEHEGRHRVRDARVRRCFPWTLRERYLSVLDSDGREICLLPSIEYLAEPLRQILLDELHDKIFNPRILRIRDHKSEFGVITFEVETDRGDVSFQVRTRDDIRMIDGRQMLLRDVDGNTYEICDLATLDPLSRRHIDEYA